MNKHSNDFYSAENLPEHILESIDGFSMKILIEILPIINAQDPNFVVICLSHVLSNYLANHVKPTHIEKSTQDICFMILNNAQYFSQTYPPLYKKLSGEIEENQNE